MKPRRFTLFAVLCSLALLLFASGTRGADIAARWKGAAPNTGDSFRFIVMSDNTAAPVPGELEEAVREINLLKPDFVMSVGDLIQGYTEGDLVPGFTTDTNVLTMMWDAVNAQLKKLDAPFYYCPGNHDISNPVMREAWLAQYGVDGKSYYSFDYRDCHFVVLDSATPAFMPDYAKEELAWLAKDLASAGSAKHIFVFYHHPQLENKAAWAELVKLFPVGKTTVFNGHTHNLSYSEPDGIPTYVLAATGGIVNIGSYLRRQGDIPNRELGMFRMFAQVSVDNGIPSVAVLPLHEVLPGDYIRKNFVDAFWSSAQSTETSSLSSKGGTVSFKYHHNTLGAPLHVAVSWNAPEWNVQPLYAEANIAPKKDAELKFVFMPRVENPDFPNYTVFYETLNPAGKKVSFNSAYTTRFSAEIDISAVRNISVDGNPSDWKDVKPYELKPKGKITYVWPEWKSEKESSALIYLGHDSQRLYVCMDVFDDQIAIDGNDCRTNDGVEFFWDSRSVDKQNGRHGIGTGQVLFSVPPEQKKPVPVWYMGNRATPNGLIAATARRPVGYICEFSVPLQELGVKMPVLSGQRINLEFKIGDRDIQNGQPIVSAITTSGRPAFAATNNYARCTFK